MKNISKTALSLVSLFFLYSCGGLSDVGKVMRNEKVSSNDEFLVKKREPLILPPDYDTLPEPMSEETINKENDNNINKILKIPNEQENSKKKSSSVEQSIINEIRK
jgi:hypothetical protein